MDDQARLLEKQDLRVPFERPGGQKIELEPALFWVRVPQMPAVPGHYFEYRRQTAQALVQGRSVGGSSS